MQLARILVAEDYEPFRRFIRSLLGSRVDCQIILEVSDGLEAVEQVKTLHPDVVLLDLGLPRLNGIAAARLIRELEPLARILIVTQDSSPDVVQSAFSLGVCGYVVKWHAASELLPALASVLQGQRFFSPGLLGHN